MKKQNIAAAMLISGLTVGVVTTPIAMADFSQQEARELKQAGTIKSLTDILALVEKQQPGRVIKVELESEHNIYVYEVEVLSGDGTVWELEYNAASGELLKHKEDD